MIWLGETHTSPQQQEDGTKLKATVRGKQQNCLHRPSRSDYIDANMRTDDAESTRQTMSAYSAKKMKKGEIAHHKSKRVYSQSLFLVQVDSTTVAMASLSIRARLDVCMLSPWRKSVSRQSGHADQKETRLEVNYRHQPKAQPPKFILSLTRPNVALVIWYLSS
ncbi:unnamed protein product [Protopolystoma xenopodis]|uniref:Uncharacterized protein n=1 Tax=Protopolystoma xenopodis TaxID=117903 RepID=A0A3S5CQI7_9PLAT|nr:unnamed protein product [Protopolystoma xenopodis]